MNLLVNPSAEMSGRIELPPSKFYTQFGVAVSILANGKSIIEHPLNVEDTSVMLRAAEALGALVKKAPDRWSIWGVGGEVRPDGNTIQARNSGTGIGLLTSIACLASRTLVLTGDRQLMGRPMPELLKGLRKLGPKVHSTKTDESPPFVTQGGKLRGGKVRVDERTGLHYLHALLLPCPLAEKETNLQFQGKLYPNLEGIAEIMKKGGVKLEVMEKGLRIPRGGYQELKFRPPQELSSAAPFVTAALLLDSKLEITSETKMSGRDREFLRMLEKFDSKITRRSNGFYIRGPQRLKGAEIDLSQAPELLPWVAVLACRGKGRTEIRNAGRARAMKSDRIAAIKEGLQRMGAKIQEYRDGLVIHGPTEFRGAQVDGHADYAVISALVVAGSLAKKETIIKNSAEALRTSYSRLISSFKELGLDVSTKP